MGTRSDLRGFLKQERRRRRDKKTYSDSNEIGVRGSESERGKEESDEMVKYMSKLPAYLQGEESRNKDHVVLNVGVLDWSRLEKWKQQHARDKCDRRRVSSTTTTTLGTTLPKASSHHQVHACSNLHTKVKASRDLQHSSSLEPQLPSSRESLNKQEIATCCSFYKSGGSLGDQEISVTKNPGKSSRRSPSYHHHPQQLASSGLFSDMGNSYSGGSLGAKGSFDKEKYETRAEEVRSQEEGLKRCTDKLDGEGNHLHQVGSNILLLLLLRSRKQSPSTTLSLSSESLDDNAKVAREEVNRSLDAEDMMKLPLLGAHLSAKIKRMHSKTASRIFDQEKKRDHSPPSKRFSFSFGRLSTSFTFKEEDSSSAATQPLTCFDDDDDDTVNKSDSMRCDNSTSQSSNPEEEKHCASRVSPLRRLLLDHPLLKSKRSENLVLPSEATSSSSFNQDEKKKKKKKQDASRRTRALLQLTIRNGMPLFQFVVDDDDDDNLKSRSRSRSRRSILGATMKPSDSSSFKDDSVQYCTFYSVKEVVKKKRSWLIHGHKDKQQHRLVYNVIGEMRLSNVSSVMRESVLVDESEEKVVKGRKEVAAVVIKKKKPAEETTTTVIVPGGVHSIPEKGGAPTPLISRWRSGGCCDCGGWDVGCKLHILSSSKTSLHDLEDQSSFKLFHQQEEEESGKNSGPVLAMTELKTGIYRVEFGSFLSHLQAFFVCVTVITCASESEEETVSKTTGKSSSSPFAPPLSPVGRA